MNKKILSSQWLKYAGILVVGLLLGWLLFKDSEVAHEAHEHDETTENTIWTCSMHPQIRQTEPGNCPICGMELIPASTNNGDALGDFQYEMTPQAVALANVATSIIGTAQTENQLNLTGKVQVDEQNLATIAATFPGRVEQLYVNFTGQEVKKGQRLASIYSPEMITAQKELQEAASTKSANPVLYEAARERLKALRFSEGQIDAIENGKIQTQFDVYANKSGIVTNRLISVGDYVARGSAMFEVVDLGQVWVMLDAYESDLPKIDMGDDVRFTVEALPGREFTAKVTYIDPIINPSTRTASVRAETNNQDGKLKPEMFVSAKVMANIAESGETVVVPRTSVLWTGQRSIVYVKVPGLEQPTFEMREVELGPRTDDMYVVLSGLEHGEEIVTNGVFSVDAAAQLHGKASMMNPEGGRVSAVHDHGQMSSGESMSTNSDVKSEDLEKFENIDSQFKKQVQNFYQEYISIKNALVKDDPDKAQTAASTAQKALEKVNMGLLKGKAHDVWMERLKNMKASIGSIGKQPDLEVQRKSFAVLSENLFQTLVQFMVEDVNAYYQHCPMASNDQGANWLSESEEIRNPYYGESMLTCGWTVEEIGN